MPPVPSSALSLEQLAALREARRSLEIAASTPPEDVFRTFRVSDEMLRFADVEIPAPARQRQVKRHVFADQEDGNFAVYYRRVDIVGRLDAKWTAVGASPADKLRDVAAKMDAQRQRFRRR